MAVSFIGGENHRLVASHWQALSVLYTSPWSIFELTTSVVIGTDCIGSCKSNYNTITITTAPDKCRRWNIQLHQYVASHWQTLSHNVVSTTPRQYKSIVQASTRWIWILVFNATFSYIMETSFSGWKNRREPDPGQATGKLDHLRLRVECTLFVIYKIGREPTPYWWRACTSC